MPNRLAEATSPYLLQHQDNPVDWHEWGTEAFSEANARDIPVLLSVGYASCHWCHVMAHESFEDDPTALYMNENFVNIKVDREERPDVDRIYMDAVQAMTGQGGWPMTVFLTPDGEPFFAGTYFPKEATGHHPAFGEIMTQITTAWQERRGDLVEQARRLTEAVRASLPPADTAPGLEAARNAVSRLAAAYDWQHGGFGGAPKFPQAPTLEILLRAIALDLDPGQHETIAGMLRTSLDAMANGGIYDHLGGGFARYAVDREWLVPHFEKMLYDNALLARVYVRAYQLTGDESYRQVALGTLGYLLADMRHPLGGLYSGEDADSEGVEGKFYVWQWSEFEKLAGPDASLAAAAYGVSPEGNFEGANILHRPASLKEVAERFGIEVRDAASRIERVAASLREARTTRVRPGLDDKVITAWNGLALRAFAEAGAVLDDAHLIDAGRDVARFVAEHLTIEGRIQRSWRDGTTSLPGFCDDYGAMATGLFALYQATGELEWYNEGARLTYAMIELFADPTGGFFATGRDAEELIARPKNLFDNPTPSDNALAAEAIQTLAAYTGDTTLAKYIDGVGRAAGKLLEQHPSAAGHLLSVLAVQAFGIKQVAIVGDDLPRKKLERIVWDSFRPECVLAASETPTDAIPLLVDRDAGDAEARAFVCRDFVCDLPVSTADDLQRQLAITAA